MCCWVRFCMQPDLQTAKFTTANSMRVNVPLVQQRAKEPQELFSHSLEELFLEQFCTRESGSALCFAQGCIKSVLTCSKGNVLVLREVSSLALVMGTWYLLKYRHKSKSRELYLGYSKVGLCKYCMFRTKLEITALLRYKNSMRLLQLECGLETRSTLIGKSLLQCTQSICDWTECIKNFHF